MSHLWLSPSLGLPDRFHSSQVELVVRRLKGASPQPAADIEDGAAEAASAEAAAAEDTSADAVAAEVMRSWM